MELGEKLRRARLDAGLTQKQLCGDIITRNMLSQIENGTAHPSMKTLGYLAQRLGKNVSFFLEETAVLSPNQQVMSQARECFDAGDYSGAMAVLEHYRAPDAVYDRERDLMENLCLLELASQAIGDGRKPYARELLERMRPDNSYCAEELLRRRVLLQGKLQMDRVAHKLPSLDEELLLRAEEAGQEGNALRAAALLDACEDRSVPEWLLLRGKIWLAEKDYAAARHCLSAAETAFPQETAPLLEICCRELGDYRAAYEYACRQKKS